MAEFDAPRSSGRALNILLSVLAVILIGLAIGLALKPEVFSLGKNRIVDAVSISPQEAVVGGAQWRVVSQWQGSGDFQEEGSFYLVEFKPIPGWEAPAPVVLRKGAPVAQVEGVYREVAFSEQRLFSLAGASTMAHRLVPELAEFYLRHIGANEVRKVPGKAADELTLQGIFYSTKEIKTIDISGKGTPSGFADLESGACDIAMSVRRASVATEGGWAERLLTPDAEFPVAMDAVAIVVNPSNSVQAKGLSVDQVRQIFSGEVTNWSQLGGESLPIKGIALRDSFGTRAFFEDKFMGGQSLASTVREVEAHAQVADLVAQDPQAIGFCSLAFVHQAREVAIRSGPDGDPVLPSPRAIRDRTYSAFRGLYLYARSESKNVYARDFALACGSPAGQEVVHRFGFVGLKDEAEADSSGSKTVSVTTGATEVPRDQENATSAPEAPDTSAVIESGAGRVLNATAQAGTLVLNATSSIYEIPETLPHLIQVDGETVPEATRRKVYGAFREAVLGAEHLPQVFHFELGSSALDSQALKDLDLVMETMRTPERMGKKMIVVGFSDSYGSYLGNQDISLKRAEVLAAAARARGAEVVMVLGAGEELPLVSNAKRAGREQNRRAEIWIK